MTRLTKTASPLVAKPIQLYLAALAIAAAGVYATTAHAAPSGPGPGQGGTMMHMGHGPMGGSMGEPMMGGMLPRMLDRVNATPEQRAQIKQIMDRSAADRQARREAGRALREQAMALFTQPTVDANAVEALRKQQMAAHDEASKRVTLAMIEISRVLTPEQRKQIAEQMTQRREMMQRHQRERRGLDAPKS